MGWVGAFGGGAEGGRGRAREPRSRTRGRAGGERRRAGGCVGPGRASLPPRLLASPALSAHLRRPEPCTSAPSGKVLVPRAQGRRGPLGGTQGGKVLLDLGPGRSLSGLPDLAFQSPLPKPGIPSSCFCVRPIGSRELWALSLWFQEQHPVPVAAACQGGRMSPQLWNRSFRSAKACHLSPGCRAVGSGPLLLLIPG